MIIDTCSRRHCIDPEQAKENDRKVRKAHKKLLKKQEKKKLKEAEKAKALR